VILVTTLFIFILKSKSSFSKKLIFSETLSLKLLVQIHLEIKGYREKSSLHQTFTYSVGQNYVQYIKMFNKTNVHYIKQVLA